MTSQNAWLSCISYNTDKFLEYILTELTNAHKIEYWMFINHMPEDETEIAEENIKKKHKHVTIKTNGRIDSMDIISLSQEPDPDHPGKYLKCVGFRKMHDNDNTRNHKFLYDKHDKKYLESQGYKRKYNYQWEDFHVSDQDEFELYIARLQYPKTTIQEVNEAFERGESTYNLIRTGKVPLTQINFIKSFQELGRQEQSEVIRKSKINKQFVCSVCGCIKDLSEAAEEVQERIDQLYPISKCWKCKFDEVKNER